MGKTLGQAIREHNGETFTISELYDLLEGIIGADAGHYDTDRLATLIAHRVDHLHVYDWQGEDAALDALLADCRLIERYSVCQGEVYNARRDDPCNRDPYWRCTGKQDETPYATKRKAQNAFRRIDVRRAWFERASDKGNGWYAELICRQMTTDGQGGLKEYSSWRVDDKIFYAGC